MTSPLILASASPRRRALLAELGVPFQVVVGYVPEELNSEVDVETQAVMLAARKAHAVAPGLTEGLVLGADTIVSIEREMLGKPRDDADATHMLRLLSGHEHQVVTGVALVDAATGAAQSTAVTSAVHMRTLSDAEIAAYIMSGEPCDKAGAYAIQGLGRSLIDYFGGCYTNIVGLPLCAVAALLTDAGFDIPSAWPRCRLPGGASCPMESSTALTPRHHSQDTRPVATGEASRIDRQLGSSASAAAGE
jgi:septum formation protein